MGEVPEKKCQELSKKVEEKPLVPKEEKKPQVATTAAPEAKKEDTLDECLNEFENFLSELDEPAQKKMKEENEVEVEREVKVEVEIKAEIEAEAEEEVIIGAGVGAGEEGEVGVEVVEEEIPTEAAAKEEVEAEAEAMIGEDTVLLGITIES